MNTKKLVTTSMLLAAAVMLSLIKLFELPFGGTVTPASMMPVILIAYIYGTRWGIFSAFVFSILQLVTGMGTVSAFFLPGDNHMPLASAILICLIDYIAAYTVLGFSGMFKSKIKSDMSSLVLGCVFACALRCIMHIISGALFFGAWAEWFFSDSTGLSQISAFKGFCTWVINRFSGIELSLLYSAIYNLFYMIPETVITILAVVPVYRMLLKTEPVSGFSQNS